MKLSAKTSALNAKAATTMKIAIGTTFATVAMVFSAAASRTPRSTSAWTPQTIRLALAIATGVEPSPNTSKNWPSVPLIRSRQARSARQHTIQ